MDKTRAALIGQIDALLALNKSGSATPRVPGLAVELLTRSREALAALDEGAEPAAWTQPSCLEAIKSGGAGEIWAKRDCDEAREFIADPDMPDDVPLYASPPELTSLRERVAELERAVSAIQKEADFANNVIAQRRHLSGQGHVKIATSLHRIDAAARRTLKGEKDNG